MATPNVTMDSEPLLFSQVSKRDTLSSGRRDSMWLLKVQVSQRISSLSEPSVHGGTSRSR